MSWITITQDHVKARLSKDEYDSYTLTGGQLTNDGTDIVAAIISQVTAMVRGKVASCRDNLSKMGPAGTIPNECLFAAATIARDALVGALPLTEGATDVRKEELRQAHEFLNSVARCEIRIEDAAGAIPESSSESSASYGGIPIMTF